MKNLQSCRNLFLCIMFASMVLSNTNYGQINDLPPYRRMSQAIVRLEHIELVTQPGQPKPDTLYKPDGTGFVVRYKDRSYLVTARHVAEQKYDLIAHMEVMTIPERKYEIHTLLIGKGTWIFHPDSGNGSTRYVDIAVTLMPPMTTGYQSTYIPESLFQTYSIEPPTHILILGYPLDIGFELARQVPMVRTGIVAMAADQPFLKIENKFLHKDALLLDVDMFPGNSGSPVFIDPLDHSDFRLIGIVIATNLALHYAICEPTSKLKETLDYALSRKP